MSNKEIFEINLTTGDVFKTTTNTACCKMALGVPQLNRKCCFIPNALKEKYGDKYMAWFICLDGTLNDDENGRRFRNYISDDGKTIELVFDGKQSSLSKSYDLKLKTNDLLVFRKLKKSYVFVGVFNELKIKTSNGEYTGKTFIKIYDSIKL